MAEAKAVEDTLENKQYLKEHNLETYLYDAVAQMLSLRLESNKMKPTKFFKEYFCSVHQGTHILFREFSFISATPYNRLCVLKAIMQIYKPLLYKEEKLNARDYHSLLQLVFPDIPIKVVNDAFASYESQQSDDEVCLSFLDFIKAMKASFCYGELDYEANIINMQLNLRIEDFSKICEQGEKNTSNLSEADFLCSLEENGSEQTSSWSLTSGLVSNSEFKRIISLKESNSFSSDEPADGTCGKLSRSSSGSKDASKSEQNMGTLSRATTASLHGRLSGKQLSNSLSLLQTDKFDSESNFSTRRHRSKSAVAIQRSSHHGRP
ncbi:hypothetical protein X975_00607, partial [Stegodyphus mimosarum]